MATATELVKECRICALTFVNPKLLPCHHTFCANCVKKLTKHSRITCPNCRKECNEKDIVPDFRLDEFLEALKEQDEARKPKTISTVAIGRKCELCDVNGITHYCKDCDQCLSSSCMKIHLKAKVSKSHQVESIKSKNEPIRSQILTEVKALKSRVKGYERLATDFQSESDKTTALQVETADKIRRLRAQLHRAIDERFDAIDKEVLDESTNHITHLGNEKDIYSRKASALDSKCRDVELQTKDDSWLFGNGESVLGEVRELMKSALIPTISFKSIAFQLNSETTWNASKAVSVSVTRGKFQSTGDESVGEGTLSESPESVSSREWRHQRSVSVPGNPHCLRLIRGELWQCHWYGITVYDTALRRLRDVKLGNMGYVNDVALLRLRDVEPGKMDYVRDVAPLPGGDIVVAAERGLYTMTDRGERRDRIAGGLFTGVVHHADRLYAANCSPATVHVFTHSGRWTQCHSFSLNAIARWTITVSVSRNLLHVCLYGDDRLDVLSLDGELQYSAGSRGSGAAGQLNHPFIGATDDEGTTLIADQHNHRVQTLSPSRQWSIVSLHPRVESPYSALLLGGKLYISSLKDRKLHMYE